MRQATLVYMLWTAALAGQTVINGGRTVKGVWDASEATSTRPSKMGAALPPACATGEVFFKTGAMAGQNLYLCSPDSTWAQVTVAASGLTGTLPATTLPATITSNTTGNAATATALAAAPTTCPVGSYAAGIDAGGNASGCTAVSPGPVVIAAGICTTCTNSGTLATVKTVTIPAGTLAPGDLVRIYAFYLHTGGTAGYMRVAVLFGGGTVQASFTNAPSDTFYSVDGKVHVLGASSEESWAFVVKSVNGPMASTTTNNLSVSTASPINIDFQAGFSSAGTEVAALRAYAVEVVKGR